MVKNNSDYWKERFQALEKEQYQRSAIYYNDLQEQFRMATNQIQLDMNQWYQRLAENNEISYAGVKKFLKESERKEFQWSVKQYIKAGRENAIEKQWRKELENASVKYHISYLEAMKIQLQQQVEFLFFGYESGMTEFLSASLIDNYYHTAYEIAKGTSVATNLGKIDTKKISVLLNRPWAQDGVMFSNRIWTNKQKLMNHLHTELTQTIIRGASPRQAIDHLSNIMNVSKSQAGALIMTESAAIATVAQQECFHELGIEQYEVLETLDRVTCKECQKMDGMIFDRKDFQVGLTAPPFHTRCRGTRIPHFEEFTEGEQRAARDQHTGKTVLVDGNLHYKEWKKAFVDNKEKMVS